MRCACGSTRGRQQTANGTANEDYGLAPLQYPIAARRKVCRDRVEVKVIDAALYCRLRLCRWWPSRRRKTVGTLDKAAAASSMGSDVETNDCTVGPEVVGADHVARGGDHRLGEEPIAWLTPLGARKTTLFEVGSVKTPVEWRGERIRGRIHDTNPMRMTVNVASVAAMAGSVRRMMIPKMAPSASAKSA